MTSPAVRSALVLPVLLGSTAAMLTAQGVTRTMSKPEVEFRDPFTQVAAIRELRDGRLVVADTRDKIVQLVDLKTQTATKIGREGSGPGEYGLPMGVVGLPGDTTIVFDPLNSRYLTILPSGKVGETFRIEMAPARSANGPGAVGGAVQTVSPPRATDAQGRLYFEGAPLAMGPQGPMPLDSAAVTRYDRKSKLMDTVGFVQLPKNSAQIQSSGSGGQQNVQIRIGGRTPFPARDAWTVLPDGSVVIARVKDYHLDIISPTRQVARGPAVPFSPVRIGEAEKQEYRDAQKSGAATAIMRTNENGKMSTSVGAPPAASEPTAWPTTKPPFAASVVASPTGEIWVARSRSAKDEVPRYDVFSRDGKLTGSVLFPADTRLVAIGNGGAIYTVRTDSDDLQYLQRFRR